MQTLDGLVRDLIDRYDGDTQHEGDHGPGLLRRLDDLALRTGQPARPGGGTPPGSRPPTSLDAVRWSVAIKTQAIAIDMQLRRSSYPQAWGKALRAIPPNAQAACRVGWAASTVGRWHSTCLTVLGLQVPAQYFEYVQCLACGERTVYGRADNGRPRAWCKNPACVDETTGEPARYDGPRIYLLTMNRAS